MHNVSVIDSNGNTITLYPGIVFKAVNDTGICGRFQYLGLLPSEDGFYYYLRDTKHDAFLDVVLSWFRQYELHIEIESVRR